MRIKSNAYDVSDPQRRLLFLLISPPVGAGPWATSSPDLIWQQPTTRLKKRFGKQQGLDVVEMIGIYRWMALRPILGG